jgi:hypothetical protein
MEYALLVSDRDAAMRAGAPHQEPAEAVRRLEQSTQHRPTHRN